MPPYKDVPANRLVTVQAGVQLLDTTATAFLAARDAYAEEEHHNLTIALPAGGYRSHAMDVDMHARPWLYNISDGIGLLPIDWSVHRTGQCIDIANGLDWMIANGHRWNFTRPLAFDHNHFQHDPTTTAGTTIGDDDVIDDAYWKRLDIGLQSVIDQIRGSKEATIKQLREDLSYMRDTTFKSLQDGISHLTANGGDISAADRDLIISAIKAAPAATVAAIKAAL